MTLLTSLGTRLRAADPQHAAILRSMVTVALFVLVGKSMSAAKEVAVAYRYGLAAEVDAYQFLYNLIGWPLGIWASVLTAVLVPLAVRMRARGGADLPRFRAELFGLALMLGLALALLGWWLLRALLAARAGALPPQLAGLAGAALPGLVLLLPVGLVTALQSAWMLAAGQHLNTLLDCIPACVLTAAVLAFPGGGILPLVWGTLAGAVVHMLALALPVVRGRGSCLTRPRFTRVSPQWRAFWHGFGILLAGQALMSMTVVIDQFYAAALATGAIATLGYANRLLSLVLGLAAIAVARATLPIFSQAALAGASAALGVARNWAVWMFCAGLGALLLAWIGAPWAVRLLFERGQFSAADTRAVADVLRFSLPQLPFYFSSIVLATYCLSQRRFGLVFWSGVIGCAGKIAGNLALVPLLGVNGIALATTLVYACTVTLFWVALRRDRMPGRAP